MYVRLYNYFNQNHLLYDYQFGFRKHYSTGLLYLMLWISCKLFGSTESFRYSGS